MIPPTVILFNLVFVPALASSVGAWVGSFGSPRDGGPLAWGSAYGSISAAYSACFAYMLLVGAIE